MSMKKKGYNPFTMWGAWLGSISYWLIYFIFALPEQPANNLFVNFMQRLTVMLDMFNREPITFVLITVIGFLVGWAIHSLIRKLRK